MSVFPQMLLDLHDELIVDLFAGGGGASCGIELALGRQVDVAINHDAAAVSLHQANHPQTRHHVCDVFEADPHAVTDGRPVGLLWASPDCTYHSKARGQKPIRSKSRKRRALAWVVTRWAGQVRPRVIVLENVEEFAQWGPLIGPTERLRPCPRRRGQTFRQWTRSLERLGYVVEWRELRACDYGAPTIRKRLFVIARCDGAPIVWPEPTHGPGLRRPYRTAAECIDWSIPMLSIFATREEARAWARSHRRHPPVRPLAEKTMARIARGVVRYVLEGEPFIVSLAHGDSGGRREYPIQDPLGTQHGGGNKFGLVAPYLVPRYGERDGQEPRTRSIDEPAPVVVPTGNGASLVAAYLARHFTGVTGAPLPEPIPTVTSIDHHSLVAAHLSHSYTSNTNGGNGDPSDPLKTIVAGGTHHGLVAAFLDKYYGTHQDPRLSEPLHTITTLHRFGLVTVDVHGEPYVIVNIAMRMLQPRELYRAQGFPDGYVIDRGADGRKLTKTEQVRMVGNSVCPPIAAALAGANVPALRVRDEAAA